MNFIKHFNEGKSIGGTVSEPFSHWSPKTNGPGCTKGLESACRGSKLRPGEKTRGALFMGSKNTIKIRGAAPFPQGAVGRKVGRSPTMNLFPGVVNPFFQREEGTARTKGGGPT